MISFKQFLTELFDKPYSTSNADSFGPEEHKHYTYEFKAEGYEYELTVTVSSKEKAIDVAFSANGSFDLIKDIKNPGRVFATVAETIKRYSGVHTDYDITFGGDVVREKLYTRLANFIARKLNRRVTKKFVLGEYYYRIHK